MKYLFLLMVTPLIASKNLIDEIKQEPYEVSSDLTSFKTEKYGKITSSHPMIEVNINKYGYGYCTNQKVVIKHDSGIPTDIPLAGVDKLWWSPNAHYVLMRRTWDGLQYYVWDCNRNKLFHLEFCPDTLSRIASFLCVSLGLPVISYISNVAWHDNNTIVDIKQKVSWHILDDTKNVTDEIC